MGERAGFSHVGDTAAEALAKRNLLRGRCELLLGQLADEPERIVRAAEIVPDFTPALKAAAQAKAQSDSPADSILAYEKAIAADPFDTAMASAFEKVLDKVGDITRLEQFRRERGLLGQSDEPIQRRHQLRSQGLLSHRADGSVSA